MDNGQSAVAGHLTYCVVVCGANWSGLEQFAIRGTPEI